MSKSSRVQRDGSTPAKAILEDQSVWRRRHCPGFSLLLQRLIVVNGKHVDVLTLASPSRDEETP